MSSRRQINYQHRNRSIDGEMYGTKSHAHNTIEYLTFDITPQIHCVKSRSSSVEWTSILEVSCFILVFYNMKMDKRKKFNRFNTRTKNKLKYSKKKFKQMLKKKYIKVRVKKNQMFIIYIIFNLKILNFRMDKFMKRIKPIFLKNQLYEIK